MKKVNIKLNEYIEQNENDTIKNGFKITDNGNNFEFIVNDNIDLQSVYLFDNFEDFKVIEIY